MNAHGRNCQAAGSAGRTPRVVLASLPNQILFLVFFILQNPEAPSCAWGEGPRCL